ncbi:hypothetical protein AB0M47_08905 [Hamadaea sp. NPDC051192]|uniref:hypothetical protein n=1 Tax=Hamadaea sp. NPDC051192 TaxID=3154940 RepID=UPI003437C831
MREPTMTVTFSHDQALVLSDWLYRVVGSPAFDAFVAEDPTVWPALHQLSGTLETTLPDVFAAGYGEGLAAARQRLLIDQPEAPRRLRPTPPPSPGAVERTVGGWVAEDNVVTALQQLSFYIGYRYDAADEDALVGALEDTDDDTDDLWFEYPLSGSPALTVRLAQAIGGSVVSAGVTGVMDDVLAARVETVLDLL